MSLHLTRIFSAGNLLFQYLEQWKTFKLVPLFHSDAAHSCGVQSLLRRAVQCCGNKEEKHLMVLGRSALHKLFSPDHFSLSVFLND